MSTEKNKGLSNRVARAISEGDLDALDELMAPPTGLFHATCAKP